MPQPEPYYIHREGWIPVPAETLPRPTYWPAVMAAGVMMTLWGAISSVILTVAGVVVLVVAGAGWVQEFLHGRTDYAE